MKYSLSYPSKTYITSSDRKSIEYMLSNIGESYSVGYQPKGGTKYSMRRNENGFLVTVQRRIGGEQTQVSVYGVNLNFK